MTRAPHILVFDSGAGGLSVAAHIIAHVPGCQLTYAADNALFPYGDLPEADLTERVLSVMTELVAEYSPDIIVIACNTASTLVLPELRNRFSQPFVGVVPAVKPAAALSQTGVIGVLATSATVSREYTQSLIEEFAPGKQVLLHAAPGLVKAAEDYVLTGQEDNNTIAASLDGLRGDTQFARMDTLVLACTHFPLIAPAIRRNLNVPEIHILDSGEAIARRVVYWLDQLGLWVNPASKAPETVAVALCRPNPALERAYREQLLQAPLRS